jgi:aconitate hydratase
MQDATAQMAVLQFIQTGREKTAVPVTLHCDHLIPASQGSEADIKQAWLINREVYDFLSSSAQKYGMDFWKPGSGIIHQIVLENYAFPGGLMIGTDSHTPNAGGLGMAAVGVGGADAVEVMAGLAWEVLYPSIMGVKLTGELSGWCSGKDIILRLLELLTVKGGTNKILDYFGPGVESLSCTSQATAANMGAELGATCSIFPFHSAMGKYLKATRRKEIADLAEEYIDCLRPDAEVEANPERYYDDIIELNLNELEPYVAGPHSPDRARPLSRLAAEVKEQGYPKKVSAALIGSCTNSSYEDLGRAADIANQGLAKGLKLDTDFIVTPGSGQVCATAERDGYLKILVSAGAKLMSNACGPCIGQWKREGIEKGEKNSIINSYNRNFPARNDGNPETLAFIASPEIVTALALAGNLDFNPLTDELKDKEGNGFRLRPPKADQLPEKGFVFEDSGFSAPPEDSSAISVKISPDSERLQLIAPFEKWDGNEFEDMYILAKVKGKCTTDHISPAGPWLKFRGHLNNISNNMLTGAINAYSGETGRGTDLTSGSSGIPYPEIARKYLSQGHGWVIIGDENYGEGSSREHAAMSPRFLGAKAVIAKSLARIHETNLKKQGILALTFVDASDYNKVQEGDRLSILGLKAFGPGKNLMISLRHQDGTIEAFEASHTYNSHQINWFKSGSCLNLTK